MNFDMSLDIANGGVPGMDVDVVTKIEHVQNSEQPRFRFEVEEEDIQALTESQENPNTLKIPVGYITYLKVGGDNETHSVKGRNSLYQELKPWMQCS